MVSIKLIVGRIGSTAKSSTYHSLIYESGSDKQVVNLSGKNMKPICNSAKPTNIIVYDVQKADLSKLEYCSQCRKEISELLDVCKRVRYLGGNPHDNYYYDRSVGRKVFSISGLHVDRANLKRSGDWFED